MWWCVYWSEGYEKQQLAKNNPQEYKRQVQEQKRKHDEMIQAEKEAAIRSQSGNWGIRYMVQPCPYCGHYKVRYAKWEDKQFSTAFWGTYSYKLHCHYKCEKCKRMWE